MHLRNLVLSDAPLMLQWMHDQNVVGVLGNNFAEKSIKDAESFIKESWADQNNIHLAIANDDDTYMGTVSLKNMNNGVAEFAIVIRSDAMSHGFAWFGMKSILVRAFHVYGLDYVYWCVKSSNKRAIRFYEKHAFHKAINVPTSLLERYAGKSNLLWYAISRGDKIDKQEEICSCRIVHINTISSASNGQLSVFEANREIPFPIRRFYYISNVPEGTKRGFHAHKTLKQLLFCPYGQILISLENDNGKEEILLSNPSTGILIEKPTWREMTWLQKDSVLCVAASDYYNPNDYIRDYGAFIEFIKKEPNAYLCGGNR